MSILQSHLLNDEIHDATGLFLIQAISFDKVIPFI